MIFIKLLPTLSIPKFPSLMVVERRREFEGEEIDFFYCFSLKEFMSAVTEVLTHCKILAITLTKWGKIPFSASLSPTVCAWIYHSDNAHTQHYLSHKKIGYYSLQDTTQNERKWTTWRFLHNLYYSHGSNFHEEKIPE